MIGANAADLGFVMIHKILSAFAAVIGLRARIAERIERIEPLQRKI
jgi:hypothetical protein